MKLYAWAVVGAGAAGIAPGLFGAGIMHPQSDADLAKLDERLAEAEHKESLHPLDTSSELAADLKPDTPQV